MASQSSNLPTAAEEGFKDAASYDAYRPSYPPEAVDAFLTKLNIAQQFGSKIVEIASGTGKFTELLARRPESFTVKAIEPHHGMREKLAQKDLAGVEVIDGKADKMPIEDEWGEACIAAQVRLYFIFNRYVLWLEANFHPTVISLVRYLVDLPFVNIYS